MLRKEGSRDVRVVGREAELALLGRFLSDDAASAFVLIGEPGVGKTTLWEAGAELARRQGVHVLVARPSEAESELSFAALGDLFDEVDVAALPQVPAPQLRAVGVALRREEAGAAPPDSHAIAAGVRGVLRTLARRRPMLVAVDDVHWLDAASAQALAFAARRLADDRVRFLLARRKGDATAVERAFAPARLEGLELAGLSFGAVRSLLAWRLDAPLPRRVLRWVFELSGGNPLFALELGRNLIERGVPEPGEELPVLDQAEDLAGERVERLAPAVRALLLAVALSPDLRRSQLASIGDAASVDDGIEAGVLTVDGDRVRAAHPLLAAAVRARAAPGERRAMHLRLSAATGDEELRARHLALGTDQPDPALAERLDRASARAASRGATADAVELAGQALRLTPSASARRAERLLVLSERLLLAGEHARASALLAAEFDSLPAGPARARAHLLLAESEFRAPVEESGTHLQRAIEESRGEPALQAMAAARWSRYLATARVERLKEAEQIAGEALPTARGAGPAVEREVLHALALARKLRGLPISDLRARFEAVSADAFHLRNGIDRLVADRLATRGQIREARTIFRSLLALADERGEAWSSIWLLHQLCELELRAGEWEAASRLIGEWAEAQEHPLLGRPALERCRALLAAGQGRSQEAERWAARAIAACETDGLRWNLLQALRARGLAALLAHKPAVAAESLGAVWAHTEREGVEEPAEFPVAPDLVEALLELDEPDGAQAVSDRLRQLAVAQEHPWGLTTATRCEALLALASTRDEAALQLLSDAAAAYLRLGLRFDHGRTLLAAGRAARRLRKWSAARGLLEQAIAAFDAIGSDGWADDARAELARVGGRRPEAKGVLTAAEQQATALAANGLSNKEIAAALVISPSTVETHLKHAYAKLGVHSRTQLLDRRSRAATDLPG